MRPLQDQNLTIGKAGLFSLYIERKRDLVSTKQPSQPRPSAVIWTPCSTFIKISLNDLNLVTLFLKILLGIITQLVLTYSKSLIETLKTRRKLGSNLKTKNLERSQ